MSLLVEGMLARIPVGTQVTVTLYGAPQQWGVMTVIGATTRGYFVVRDDKDCTVHVEEHTLTVLH